MTDPRPGSGRPPRSAARRRVRRAALGVGLLLAACADPAPRPSVLLVVLDTTRADDVSVFEPERAVTPNLDALAERGVRFRDAWSLYSVTVPSHVSLFTGRAVAAPAEQTGAPAPPDYRSASLFTILRERGYRSYVFAGNPNLHPDHIEALAGLDVVGQPRPEPEASLHYQRVLERYAADEPARERWTAADLYARRRTRPLVVNDAEWVTRQALAAMRDHAAQHPDRPYLLFLNYNDAHDPYFPEPPWDTRFPSPPDSRFNGDLWSRLQRHGRPTLRGLALSMSTEGLRESDIERARALHLGTLAQADAQLGALLAELAALDLLDGTLVVVASDHGEAFGEGGRMAHGGFGDEGVQRALLHVPLVMLFPDATIAPGVIEQRVDLRDVKPTLLDFLGIEDESSEGRSLMPLIRRQTTTLPAAAPRPQDHDPSRVGENLIGGQSESTSERLRGELRALGYIE